MSPNSGGYKNTGGLKIPRKKRLLDVCLMLFFISINCPAQMLYFQHTLKKTTPRQKMP